MSAVPSLICRRVLSFQRPGHPPAGLHSRHESLLQRRDLIRNKQLSFLQRRDMITRHQIALHVIRDMSLGAVCHVIEGPSWSVASSREEVAHKSWLPFTTKAFDHNTPMHTSQRGCWPSLPVCARACRRASFHGSCALHFPWLVRPALSMARAGPFCE